MGLPLPRSWLSYPLLFLSGASAHLSYQTVSMGYGSQVTLDYRRYIRTHVYRVWYVWFTIERSDVDSFRIRKDGKFVETFIEIFDNILSKFYCSILRPSVGFSCQLGGEAIFRSLHPTSSVTKLRRRKLFFESPNFLWFIRSIEKCWRRTYVAIRLCCVS